MNLIESGGVTYDLDEGGYWWRRFVRLNDDGRVIEAIAVGHRQAQWAVSAAPDGMIDVTTSEQWAGDVEMQQRTYDADTGLFSDPIVDAATRIPLDVFITRITLAEHLAFETMAESSRTARVWWARLMARSTSGVLIESAELTAGWAFVKAAGIPGIWPDEATADARIAAIMAPP